MHGAIVAPCSVHELIVEEEEEEEGKKNARPTTGHPAMTVLEYESEFD